MAGIRKFSNMDDMRGKLGNNIISKNRYKSFMYEKPDYIDKQTPAQLKTRQLHRDVIKLWQTMTPKDIEFIDRWAAQPSLRSMCSPAKITDGYSLFYYFKRNLQEIGEKITKEVVITYLPVQHLTDFKVEWHKFRKQTGMRLFIDPILDENTKLIIYATHSIPGGIGKPKPSWYRKKKVIDNKFISGSYITADYLKIFKEIDKETMTIYFRYKTIDKRCGLASNPEVVRFPLSILEMS